MSPTEVKRRAKLRLDSLSPERLRVADDFLAYLEDREGDEATEELLRIPGFRDALRIAEAEAEKGLLTPVEKLRRIDLSRWDAGSHRSRYRSSEVEVPVLTA